MAGGGLVKYELAVNVALSLLCFALLLCCSVLLGTLFAERLSGAAFGVFVVGLAVFGWVFLERYVLREYGADFSYLRKRAVSAGVLLLAVVCVYTGVYKVYQKRYAGFKQAVAREGFATSMSQFSNTAKTRDLGVFASDKIINSGTFNRENRLVSGIPFGRWNVERILAAKGVSAKYKQIFDKEIYPVIRRGDTIDVVEYSTYGINTRIPSFSGVVLASRLAGCIAVSEVYSGRLPKAWDYIEAQFVLADMIDAGHTVLCKAVARVIREQGVAAASAVVSARAGTVAPEKIKKRLSAIIERSADSEIMSAAWGERFLRFDAFQTDGFYRKPGRRVFPAAAKLAALMLITAVGPDQLEFDRAVKAGFSGDEYGQFLRQKQRLDGKISARNFLFLKNWPQFSEQHALNILLKTKAKMVLMAFAVNERKAALGLYPPSLEGLNLSADTIICPLDGTVFRYRVLPDNTFSLECAVRAGFPGLKKTEVKLVCPR